MTAESNVHVKTARRDDGGCLVTVTRDELLERKRQVLARVGMTREEIAECAADYLLTGEEFQALLELEEIEFFSGGDTPTSRECVCCSAPVGDAQPPYCPLCHTEGCP